MKITKYLSHLFFKLIDLIISDEILFKFLTVSKNKLIDHFIVFKTNLERQKQGPKYWASRSAIYYFIYAKNLVLKNTNTEKILNKLSRELEMLSIETKYLEIGCGYPIYLKSTFLMKKIKNYYGYDINPHISEFFKIKNVHNKYPTDYDYDVILFLSGVIKYFSEDELNILLKLLNKINPKKIIISHEHDYKIFKNKVDQLKSNYEFEKFSNIEIILI